MKRIVASGVALAWSLPAAAQAPKQETPPVPTFCQDYVELAGDFAGIAKWFLIAALGLGIAYAVVETIKKSREPVKDARVDGQAGASTLKDVAEALKGLVEALSKASVWLALFACGMLLFWFAGHMVPAACSGEMTKPLPAASSS
jgi:hypothetical protein